jgi:hypothetical protein
MGKKRYLIVVWLQFLLPHPEPIIHCVPFSHPQSTDICFHAVITACPYVC